MQDFRQDFIDKPVETKKIGDGIKLNNFILSLKKEFNFNIFHLNVRSIHKNFDELKINLKIIQTKFECIVLTETFHVECVSSYKLDNYDMVYSDGSFNRNDGVIVYLKSSLIHSTRKMAIAYCTALESTIQFDINRKIVITSLYRSPAGDKEEFIKGLANYLEHTKHTSTDQHYLVGDMNLNILDEHNEIICSYLDVLGEHNFLSLINAPTHIQGNAATCLDHIFLKTNMEIKVNINCFSAICDLGITDHYATVTGIFINNIKNPQSKKYKQKKYVNYTNLKKDFVNKNWRNYFENSDPNELTDELCKTINDVVNQNTHVIRRKRQEVPRKDWITSGLIKSIQHKNNLKRIHKSDPTSIDKRNEYTKFRNILNRLINKSKFRYFQKQIEYNRNSSKGLWDVVRTLTEEQTGTVCEIASTENSREMANKFNEHFTNVGKRYAENIPKTEYTKRQENRYHEHSFFLTAVDDKEVVRIIKELPLGKSPGLDNIRTETIKFLSQEISPMLTHLINKIFETGTFPESFKNAIVVPIFKKGCPSDLNNYRPISLLSIISKIVERSLKERLIHFCDKYKIISHNQFGFRRGFSTADAISTLTAKINKLVDENKPVLCVFLDLAKAFDTVSHKQLLETLEDIGIRGIPLKLFESYLRNRVQAVKIGETIGEPASVTYGVPQGTVLGPFLFTVYINQLLLMKTRGEIISFADDTAVLYTSNTWSNLKNEVEVDMTEILNWFHSKLLTINFDKTFFVPFTSYANNLPNYNSINIELATKHYTISKSSTIKYLGVIIDSHLKWDKHIDFLARTVRRILYKLKILVKILNYQQLKSIYFALVQARLQYAIVSWGACYKTHLRSIDVLQKKCIKIIIKKPIFYPSDLTFSDSKLLDLRQIYFLNVLLYTYKNKHILTEISHKYGTRSKNKHNVITPTVQKTLGQRCYTYLCHKFYNFLPEMYRVYLLKINSVQLFKKMLKIFLINSNRKEIHDLIE